MGEHMTVKEMCAATDRTEYWLRNHICAWCDADAIGALRWGCMAIYKDMNWNGCDVVKRFSNHPPSHPADNKG